jgi:hypothetical protein
LRPADFKTVLGRFPRDAAQKWSCEAARVMTVRWREKFLKNANAVLARHTGKGACRAEGHDAHPFWLQQSGRYAAPISRGSRKNARRMGNFE